MSEADRSILESRLKEMMSRPEFSGARWGMEFYYPDTEAVIYALHSDQLFQPASSAKIFTAGTAFSTLGPDYRFHTCLYRTGPVKDGVLNGDLVLKASGDLLLGGRIRADGTLNLPDPDHTYDIMRGSVPVSDDPVQSIRDIANQIAASGIKRIAGNIWVDDTLFRKQEGEIGGTWAPTVSPIVINDNLVDVMVMPGNRVGEPAALHISPETTYVEIINNTRTIEASETQNSGMFSMMGPGALQFVDDVTNGDGTHTVTLTGNIPLGGESVLRGYRIPEPARFAELLLAQMLREQGILVDADSGTAPDFEALSTFYTPENQVAELVSPPLSVAIQVMLKLSSNPHALIWPYLVGAIAGQDRDHASQTGSAIQHRLFADTGVQPGGDNVAKNHYGWEYSPRSFTNFLTYLSRQPYRSDFMDALPIMGRDGTLVNVQPDSPAAGHVYAKTGTLIRTSDPSQQVIHVAKALAGYITLPDGRIAVFSEFLEYDVHDRNFEPANQVMGEIANAVYEFLVDQS